jgi:hypothetical protein
MTAHYLGLRGDTDALLLARRGSAIGVPFSFEGIFFLLEAVFTRSICTAGTGCRGGCTSGPSGRS